MKQRRIFTALLAVALMIPVATDASQTGKVHRIGMVFFGLPTDRLATADALIDGLKASGWVDGKNISIERRYAEGRSERLAPITAELVALNVDVLVAFGTDLADAAKNATSTIPIVMGASADPIEKGLVASLRRPGGNMTGIAFMSPELSGKRLELLKEIVPGVVRVAVLWDPTYSDQDFKELRRAATVSGVELQSLEVRSPHEFDAALRAGIAGRAQALVVAPSRLTMFAVHRKQILKFAEDNRLPTISSSRAFAESGGLMSYGPHLPDLWRRAASQVDKILRSAKPADLPVELPTKFELVVNRKTAHALGLTIPPSLLQRADDVIE